MVVTSKVREGFAQGAGVELFVREVGEGRPLVVIHGGPDFDHTYLLPDFDRLASGYRLVYYDQRGRGRSRGAVDLETLAIDRYVDDLEAVRRHLGLDKLALVGHSWGGLVGMHYALREPRHASHLVLMNSVPASNADLLLMREERLRRHALHEPRLAALMPGYARADPGAVSEYYAIDFGTTFRRREDAGRLHLRWSRKDILQGRAIEARLAQGLVWSDGFTLLPELAAVRVPTLAIHGDLDFVPIEASEHIVQAIPGAQLAVLADSGHFSYIDAPEQVRTALDRFFAAHP